MPSEAPPQRSTSRKKSRAVDSAFDPEAFELRLFLSVDIVGSTALKHRRNHHELHELYRSATDVIDSMGSAPLSADQRGSFDAALLRSLGGRDLDWARIVERCFSEFHARLQQELAGAWRNGQDRARQGVALRDYERHPWKAIGDELVYSVRVDSVAHAHQLLTAFLRAVRAEDAKWSHDTQPEIRLKAAGWIAGFPVNNRKVQLPMLHAHPGVAGARVAGASPWPKMDYLGPDIDIGFRIGKCTWAGMCVVSLALAEFLASDDAVAQKVLLLHVGWESLKGVWGDQPYPVVWAELNKAVREGFDANLAESAEAECRFVGRWRSNAEKLEAHQLRSDLERIRTRLPANFGAIVPYVPGADPPSEVERKHIQLRDLARRVQEAERERKTPGALEMRGGAPDIPAGTAASLAALERRDGPD